MKKYISLLLSVLFLIPLFCSHAGAKELKDMKVVVYGDSISAAGKWEEWFEGHTGVHVINKGVGGDSTRTAKIRLGEVLGLKPDVVFIEFGTNDAAIDMNKYTELSAFKQNLRDYIDAFEKIGARVILITPPPVDDEKYLTRHNPTPFEPYGGPNGLVTIYAQAVREVAAEKHVVLADVHADFNALDNYKNYLSDGVHPTNDGYSKYTWTCINTWRKMWRGDINVDGKVNSKDYMLVKRAVLKTYTLTSPEAERADVNVDEKLDAKDYMLLKRAALGTYTIE